MQSNEYKQGGIEPQSAEEIKFIHMTQKPVKSLVCSLAIPSIISMLISAFYNMADTFFVGKIGTSATGAVGVIFPLMALIQAIGFFFGHGSGNFMSRKLGAQQNQEANEIASVGFYTSLVIGIIVMCFGFLFLNPLARVLGATETILPYAKDYLIFILLGIPFMLGSLVLNNQLRFQGSSFYGMIGISIGAIINIALDPLFIFGFGLGVKGASLATMVSQGISFILLYYLAIKKADLGVVLKYFKPCLTYFKEMIRGGFPSLCRRGLASLAVICLNQIAGGYGDAAIAAMSIVSRVGMFAVSALIGFGQGFQPVCGFNYGAKLYDRVREAFWFCVKVEIGRASCRERV